MIPIELKISLACLIIHISFTWNGMVLHDLHLKLKVLPEFIRKPVYECMFCMTTVWTPIIWFGTGHAFGVELFFTWLIVGGINALICVTLDKITEYGC